MKNIIEDLDLEEFTPDNCTSVRGSAQKAKFTLNVKSGLICFNRGLSEQLKLENGSLIIFHQNKNKPEDWYLEIGVSGGLNCVKIKLKQLWLLITHL